MRPFIQGYNGDFIKEYVRKELEKRLAEMKDEQYQTEKKKHSVTSLALEGYLKEGFGPEVPTLRAMDRGFVEIVTNQIRLFLFAGNDTTASAIA